MYFSLQLPLQIFWEMVLPALYIKRLRVLHNILCKIGQVQSDCQETNHEEQFLSLAIYSQLDFSLGIDGVILTHYFVLIVASHCRFGCTLWVIVLLGSEPPPWSHTFTRCDRLSLRITLYLGTSIFPALQLPCPCCRKLSTQHVAATITVSMVCSG